jgi:ABC-type uncharacterized transport system permease subunit
MKVYLRFFINSLKDVTEFRFDFLMGLLDLLVYMASIFLFWKFVSAGGAGIAGWRVADLMLLGAFAGLYISLNGFFSGCWYLSGKILEGELDKYLARPVNPYFAIMAECLQVDELIRGLLSFALLFGIYASQADHRISLPALAAAAFIFICGTLSLVFMKSVVSLLTVWYGDLGAFKMLLHFEDLQFEKYPTTLYGKAVSRVFNYVLCIGLVTTVPVLVLLDKASYLACAGAALLSLLVWSGLLAATFKKAMTHYESFGG